MNPYPSKGAGKGQSKCKCKRRLVNTITEIKQEVVVKEEPVGNIKTAEVTRPSRKPPSTEEIGATKSEAETDSEMYNDYDTVKKEDKSEDECAKKDCDSARDASSNCGDDLGDVSADESVHSPRQSSSSKGGKKKRMVEGRKPSNRKKETNAKASKEAAVKRQKKHMCHLCNYAASFKSHLTIHIRVHTGEKPFVCEVCSKAFTTKSNLRCHEKTHGSRLAFRCSKCSQGFAQEINKIDHESKCQRRQYECFACKYTTYKLTNLKDHMRTHSGENPFECSVCSMSFSQKNSLRAHLRTHAKQLPFACSRCGKRFPTENEKLSHEKRCTRRRFECYLCQYKCFQKINLNRHMRSKHIGEKSFECAVCDMKFCQKSYLKQHLATHTKPRPIRCSKCWKRFKNEEKTNAHEEQCNRRLHQCYLCKVNVILLAHLKYHMRAKHTREKPFPSKFCEVRFPQKCKVDLHMKPHHNSGT